MTKDNARCKIPLCRLSTLCFLCFESLIVPSLHLIQSLSLILLCFARLRTSLDSSRPSYAACDWLTDRTASARRRERTSNSSVPNVSEYSRTLSNAIRPTIARAHLSRAPSSQNFWQPLCTDTFYVADIFLWITRTIIFKSYLFFSVDIPFFRGICPSIFNATISRKE